MGSCKKIRHENKKAAKKALARIRKTPLYLKGKFIKKARNFYFCDRCKGFHITSDK